MKVKVLSIALCAILASTIKPMEDDDNHHHILNFEDLRKTIQRGNITQCNNLFRTLSKEDQKTMLSPASKSDLTQKTLLETAQERLELAEKHEQSLVTKERVKGLALSIALGGVGIYNAFVALSPEDDTSSGDGTTTAASGGVNPTNAVLGMIESGFLVYYSGRELWDVFKNHHARRKKEKALAIQNMLQLQQKEVERTAGPQEQYRKSVQTNALQIEGQALDLKQIRQQVREMQVRLDELNEAKATLKRERKEQRKLTPPESDNDSNEESLSELTLSSSPYDSSQE